MSQHNASSRSGSIHQFGATSNGNSNSNTNTNSNVEASLVPSTERYQPGYTVSVGSHRVEIVNYLAEGGFSQVYVVKFVGYTNEFDVDSRSGNPGGKSLQLGEVACLKRVLVSDDAGLEKMRNEMEVMKKLQNAPTVVQYYDSNATRNTGGAGGYEVLLLMELCSNNSLLDYMNQRLSTKLSEQEVLKIMYDITIAIAQMHYLPTPLIHRDIKIENVLVDQNNNFKLCDFGSACPCCPLAMTNNEIAILAQDVFAHTTPQYRSPEMIDLYRYFPINEKSDIWALGVFLYKLFFYTTPFERTGQYAILHSKYDIPPNNYDPRLISLMSSMLAENPHVRPNIYQVLHSLCDILGMQCPLNDKYGKGPYDFKKFGEYQAKLRNLEYQLVFLEQRPANEWSSSDDKIYDELFVAYFNVLPKLDVTRHSLGKGYKETDDNNDSRSQHEMRPSGMRKNVSSGSVPLLSNTYQQHLANERVVEERMVPEDGPGTYFPEVSELNNMTDEEFKSSFRPPNRYPPSIHSDGSGSKVNDIRNIDSRTGLSAPKHQQPQAQKSQGSTYSGMAFNFNSGNYPNNNSNNNNNNNGNATTFTTTTQQLPQQQQQQQSLQQPTAANRESQPEVRAKPHKSNNPFPNIQQSVTPSETQLMDSSSHMFSQQQQQNSNRGSMYIESKAIPVVNPKRNSYHSGFSVGSLPVPNIKGTPILNPNNSKNIINNNNGGTISGDHSNVYSKSYTQVSSTFNQRDGERMVDQKDISRPIGYGTPDQQQTFQAVQKGFVSDGRNAGLPVNKGKLSSRNSVTRQTIQLPVGIDPRFQSTMNGSPYQQQQQQQQQQQPFLHQYQPQRNTLLERQLLNSTPADSMVSQSNNYLSGQVQPQQVQNLHAPTRGGETDLLLDFTNLEVKGSRTKDDNNNKNNTPLDEGAGMLKKPLDLSYNEMNLSRDSSIDEASIPIGGNSTNHGGSMLLFETDDDLRNAVMAGHDGNGSSLSVVSNDNDVDDTEKLGSNRVSHLQHGGRASRLGHMKKGSASSSVSILVDLEEIGQKINQLKEKNGPTEVVLRGDANSSGEGETGTRNRKHGSMETKRKSLDLRYQEINFSNPNRIERDDPRRRSYAIGAHASRTQYVVGDVGGGIEIDDTKGGFSTNSGSNAAGEGDRRNMFSRPSEIKDDLSGILKGKNGSSSSLLGGRPSFSRTRKSLDISRLQRDGKRNEVKATSKGPRETTGGGRKSIFSIFKSEKK